jgi:hypothetical protein
LRRRDSRPAASASTVSGRDRKRPHDLVVVDQERNLSIEKDFGSLAGGAFADR